MDWILVVVELLLDTLSVNGPLLKVVVTETEFDLPPVFETIPAVTVAIIKAEAMIAATRPDSTTLLDELMLSYVSR